MRTLTKNNKKLITSFAGVALVATISGTAAQADHTTPQPTYTPVYEAPAYNPGSHQFRANHPMRVFVKIGGNRHSNGDGHHSAPAVYQKIDYHLPSYITLVNSPAYADLVIKVRQTDYKLNYRVIDVDRKDKKYKKSRRYAGGNCGYFRKAFYTKVKEKGEAYASYNVKVRFKGYDTSREHFTLRSAENYSYGTELRAITNCGIRPTNRMPSNGVAKLFSRSGEGYRNSVSHRIKRESIADLGRHLAHQIQHKAGGFYPTLAAKLNHERIEYGYDHNFDTCTNAAHNHRRQHSGNSSFYSDNDQSYYAPRSRYDQNGQNPRHQPTRRPRYTPHYGR
ncbi:MAG: hypothetical protein COB37_02580 [Kordiimonadales bacterium]|nr:MAG: hypothetical protein COB37_02580 [Kordiimonadales bacterium]